MSETFIENHEPLSRPASVRRFGLRPMSRQPEPTPGVTEGPVQDYMEQHSELIPLPSLLGHDLHMGCVISKFELDRCRVPDLTRVASVWSTSVVRPPPPTAVT